MLADSVAATPWEGRRKFGLVMTLIITTSFHRRKTPGQLGRQEGGSSRNPVTYREGGEEDDDEKYLLAVGGAQMVCRIPTYMQKWPF